MSKAKNIIIKAFKRDAKKERGLRVIIPDVDLAKAHITKARHNTSVLDYLRILGFCIFSIVLNQTLLVTDMNCSSSICSGFRSGRLYPPYQEYQSHLSYFGSPGLCVKIWYNTCVYQTRENKPSTFSLAAYPDVLLTNIVPRILPQVNRMRIF